MKKITLTDIAGTLILSLTATSILVLFFFFTNGHYVANIVTR